MSNSDLVLNTFRSQSSLHLVKAALRLLFSCVSVVGELKRSAYFFVTGTRSFDIHKAHNILVTFLSQRGQLLPPYDKFFIPSYTLLALSGCLICV